MDVADAVTRYTALRDVEHDRPGNLALSKGKSLAREWNMRGITFLSKAAYRREVWNIDGCCSHAK